MHTAIECYRLFWAENTQVSLFYHLGALLLAGIAILECCAEQRVAAWSKRK